MVTRHPLLWESKKDAQIVFEYIFVFTRRFTRGVQFCLSLMFFCILMNSWDYSKLHRLSNFRQRTTYLHITRVYPTIHWYNDCLIWAEISTKSLATLEYILTRQEKDAPRNTTFEEKTSSKVNKYFVSTTLFSDVLMVSITIEYQFLTITNISNNQFSGVTNSRAFYKWWMIICERDTSN